MNKLQPDRTQPGKRPEDVRQKDRLTLTGQGAFQENIQESIQAIGMILRSGGAVADLTARQFRLVGRTVGNTQLIKLLDAEGVGRCLRIEEAAWSLDRMPIQTLFLKKATIKQIDPPSLEKITVLFNPSEYIIESSVKYAEHNVLGLDMPIAQFVNGNRETLRMNLFFDTYSSGLEAGSMIDGMKLAATSQLTELAKIDVREYTKKIYSLMDVKGDRHAPPLVEFSWGTLSFQGYIVSVSQQFTKFTFTGKPVRAKLEVTFQRYVKPEDLLKGEPRNSPDRTKFRTISEGDTLTAIALKEYGDAEMWREIARVNNIDNPRLLRTGSVIKIPAWL